MMKNAVQDSGTSRKKSLSKLGQDFSQTTDFKKAIEIVRDGSLLHRCFQHYTTVKGLIAMITGKSMRLTRGNSLRLNDNKECCKYGDDDTWNRTYIACFSYGGAESAAMWGLYCKGNPESIRIKISQKAMKERIKSLETKIAQNDDFTVGEEQVKKAKAQSVNFRDIIYASVKGRKDVYDRSNVLNWCGEHSMKVADLAKEVCLGECSGLLKDYEWRYEDESRLVVVLDKQEDEELFVPLTREFLESMQITFSPWSKEADRKRMVGDINKALVDTFGNDVIRIDHRRNKSVLTDALRMWGQEMKDQPCQQAGKTCVKK